jgi:hypothetical protein
MRRFLCWPDNGHKKTPLGDCVRDREESSGTKPCDVGVFGKRDLAFDFASIAVDRSISRKAKAVPVRRRDS